LTTQKQFITPISKPLNPLFQVVLLGENVEEKKALEKEHYKGGDVCTEYVCDKNINIFV
jgi:hypothetical protein